MSKVIKAHFIIKDNRPFGLQYVDLNEKKTPIEVKTNTDSITPDTAADIYCETKQMMEELLDATKEKAEGILSQARAEAEELLEEKRRKAMEIKETASHEGFHEGYEKGYRLMISLLKNIEDDKDRQLKKQQDGILELIFAMTEKILGTTIETKPEVISSMIGRILDEAKEARRVTLKINPTHLPYLHELNDKYSESFAGKLQISEDPELGPGDCVVLTDTGIIEARISQQLELLKQDLLGVAGHAEL